MRSNPRLSRSFYCALLCQVVMLVGAAGAPAWSGTVQAVDGIVLVEPPDDRAVKRLDGAHLGNPAWESAPMSVVGLPSTAATEAPTLPADAGAGSTASTVSVQTSISQWTLFGQQALNGRAATVPNAGEYKVAPLVRPDPPVDAWMVFDNVQAALPTDRKTASRSGVDYKIGSTAVVGLAAASKDRDSGQSRALASYFVVRPLTAVTIDGKLGLADSRASPTDRITDQRTNFANARLRSDLPLGSFKLSPSVAFTHGADVVATGTAPAQELNTVEVAPRLSRPFELNADTKLETFVTVNRKLTLDPVPDPATRSSTSVGAGVSVKQSNSYTLDMTTSLEDLGRDKVPGVKGRIEVKVPLR